MAAPSAENRKCHTAPHGQTLTQLEQWWKKNIKLYTEVRSLTLPVEMLLATFCNTYSCVRLSLWCKIRIELHFKFVAMLESTRPSVGFTSIEKDQLLCTGNFKVYIMVEGV